MPGLLAGLDALVVAVGLLVALLVVSAVLRPLLINVLGQAPFIGGWLASNVDSGLASFQNAIRAPADASLGLLTSLLVWADTHLRGFVQGLLDLGNGILWTTWTLATVSIPHAVGQGLQQAEALIGEARAYALGLVQAAEQRAGALFTLAEQDAAALVTAARQEAQQEVGAAERVVLDEIRKAEQAAGQLWQQAEYDAGQLVAASESKLAQLVQLARQDLGAAVGAVEHDLQQLAKAERVLIEDTTSILGGDIQAAEARAQAALSGLEEATQKSIEGILNALPWQSLAAAVGASEAMLQAEVRTLVGLGAQEIRKAVADAPALRAKYGPEIRAALAQLAPR